MNVFFSGRPADSFIYECSRKMVRKFGHEETTCPSEADAVIAFISDGYPNPKQDITEYGIHQTDGLRAIVFYRSKKLFTKEIRSFIESNYIESEHYRCRDEVFDSLETFLVSVSF